MITRLIGPFAFAVAGVVASGIAHANAPTAGQAARAEARYARTPNSPAATPTVAPANKAAAPAASAHSGKPLHAVTGVAPGQAGYVHYFLLRMPDDSTEVQVGIELADQTIAWSFPGLGVVVSPFMEATHFEAGGRGYDVWYLYGLRPFADNAAMSKLQRELPARVERWVKADIPYCLDDRPARNCMSCLGFVLRALYPGRGDYPAMPQDFWRAVNPFRYTPNDLLLYLTGMLDLPSRSARLQRINRLELPADLRNDLERLIYAMGAHEAAPREAMQKRAGTAAGKQPRL